MKTKEFDRIKPYTYVLIKKSNNKKYYGVRRRNIHLNTAPINDFGKNYKSSGGFCEEFKKYPNRFKVVFRWTFSSLEEAKEYEEKITKILIRKSQWKNWINKACFPTFILDEQSRKKLSIAGKKKTGEKNGMFNKTHTLEARLKISKVSKQTMSKIENRLKAAERCRKRRGYVHKHETKQKIRESQLGPKSHRYGKAPVNKGTTMSIEQRIKISKAKTGKKTGPPSEEHKRKISEAKKGIGRSEETKRKISLAHKRMWEERRVNV